MYLHGPLAHCIPARYFVPGRRISAPSRQKFLVRHDGHNASLVNRISVPPSNLTHAAMCAECVLVDAATLWRRVLGARESYAGNNKVVSQKYHLVWARVQGKVPSNLTYRR